jgi:hypothetical protein
MSFVTKLGTNILNVGQIVSTLPNNTISIGVDNTTLKSLTYGVGNTAIGQSALNQNTYGYYNLAVGETAMINNTTGSFNTAIGLNGLGCNIAGDNNTSIGVNAGNNTFLGSSSNNSFLGYDTQLGAATHSKCTLVGANAISTATNQVVLGTSTETVVCKGALTISGQTNGQAANFSTISATGAISGGAALTVSGPISGKAASFTSIQLNGTSTIKGISCGTVAAPSTNGLQTVPFGVTFATPPIVTITPIVRMFPTSAILAVLTSTTTTSFTYLIEDNTMNEVEIDFGLNWIAIGT